MSSTKQLHSYTVETCVAIKGAPRRDVHPNSAPHDTCLQPKQCGCECEECVRVWIRNGAPGGVEIVKAHQLVYERLG